MRNIDDPPRKFGSDHLSRRPGSRPSLKNQTTPPRHSSIPIRPVSRLCSTSSHNRAPKFLEFRPNFPCSQRQRPPESRRQCVLLASTPIAPSGATTMCGRTGCWPSAAFVRRIARCCRIAARTVAVGSISLFARARGARDWSVDDASGNFARRERRMTRSSPRFSFSRSGSKPSSAARPSAARGSRPSLRPTGCRWTIPALRGRF